MIIFQHNSVSLNDGFFYLPIAALPDCTVDLHVEDGDDGDGDNAEHNLNKNLLLPKYIDIFAVATLPKKIIDPERVTILIIDGTYFPMYVK